MINALASLTKFYKLPLAIIMSWRGIYKEPIEAQKPMGKYAPELLKALEIPFFKIEEKKDIPLIEEALKEAYSENKVMGVLLSPKLWEGSSLNLSTAPSNEVPFAEFKRNKKLRRVYMRIDFIKAAEEFLRGKAVVSNLGVPSKEVYSVLHQKSNFYMLGSMGMVSAIALGVALNTEKEVVALDGDGSLLMNPSTLATIARYKPENLTILALDNGAYGSTGNQLTHTALKADLACAARGFGIEEVIDVDSPEELRDVLSELREKPAFIRCLCRAGNADVENIPLTPEEIKDSFMEFLRCE